MKKPNQTTMLTGMIAGIASTMLTLGANVQPSLASVLYAASALPIFIAGLGWGNMAAIVAIATSATLGFVVVNPFFALTMTAFTLAPAGWLSHLANLARPASELGGPDDLMAWYPLSDILLHLCGLVALAVIGLGIVIGYGPELTSQVVDIMMGSLQTQDAAFVPDAASIAQTKSLVVLMLPMIQGGLWVMLLFCTYYIANRVVSASGRRLRPREDVPSALRMNRNAIFIFLGGVLAMFLGGVPAMIGATVCGAFGAGFLMAGFASLHFRSRGKDWRVPALVLAYLSSIFFLPTILILVLGLADTRRTIALTPLREPKKTNETNL